MNKVKSYIAVMLALSIGLSPLSLAYADSTKTIVGNAVETSDLSTLVTAVTAAELAETLNGSGPFTVFAPNNAAFGDLDGDTLSELLLPENQSDLQDVLLYHVVAGSFLSSDLSDGQIIEMVNGDTVEITIKDNVMVNDATVTNPNIMASNGVIHIIDSVLIPPSDELPSIVDIATNNEDFSSLVNALSTAGLVEALQADGPFTVFAPTNEAFNNMPNFVKRAIEQDPEVLKDILLYHVVSGKIASEDIGRMSRVESLEGSTLTARSLQGEVTIDGAHVTAADIEASNGVVHVIDEVIIPRSVVQSEFQRVLDLLREIIGALSAQ